MDSKRYIYNFIISTFDTLFFSGARSSGYIFHGISPTEISISSSVFLSNIIIVKVFLDIKIFFSLVHV